MKKGFKLSVLLLSATLLLSSCIGSFSLTNRIKNWNEGVGGKFINEVIFVALHIVPVYEISIFVDALVLNSIEFWTGRSVAADEGETRIVKNSNGDDIEVTALENGYRLSDGENAMSLLFDNETKVWSAVYGNHTSNLVKLLDDNKALLYLMGGEVMDITLDAEGLDVARACMLNSFAMSK